MRKRCVEYFVRGFFWIGPRPFYHDFRCWTKGNGWSLVVILTAFVVGSYGLAFVLVLGAWSIR